MVDVIDEERHRYILFSLVIRAALLFPAVQLSGTDLKYQKEDAVTCAPVPVNREPSSKARVRC